jgi:general secretion pathway protein G
MECVAQEIWMKRPAWSNNFTVELLVAFVCVIACILIIGGSGYRKSLLHAREAVSKQDVATMRKAIEDYTLTTERPPQSLQDLVDEHFLAAIPNDALTGKKDWVPHFGYVRVGSGKIVFGIDDVHSRMTNTNSDGAPYNNQ